MRRWNFSHHAISSCVTAALLAGCGGSQPPIGTPGALPQGSALAQRTGSANYKVLYSFGKRSDDGNLPEATLVDLGGTLYGTTAFGGGFTSYAHGTVFSITPGGKEKVLYSFGRVPDGNTPEAGLISLGGTFYGTTSGGGLAPVCTSNYYPCGTVFSITPSGTEKVLHSFGNKKDGFDPVALLIEVNGTLYGTTEFGGAHHKCCGTVFSITPSGTYKVLHNFGAANDGSQPLAPLIEVKGKLYGTTEFGGAHGPGTVFSITLSGKEKVLYSFNGTDGSNPSAGLIDVKGRLYGTTPYGGTHNSSGTLFSVTTSGKERVLHNFGKGTDGAAPVASLVELKGTLYGTTENGGPYY
ncbi:MAG: choice-of-anchor tandem repeat GloVer-containing protein, partial [Candidatus Cybelea sp.]